VRALTSSLSSTLASSSDVDGLVAHLRRIAGDRSVRLLFREPSGRDVDEQGQPTQRDVRLAATVVERDGEPIAVIEHEPSSGNVVAAALTPAVTVAIENERLRALAQSELDALRTSRRRIVERADETRRRLERDLHDGAQQRLLLLGMELSRAAASADDPCERDRYLVAVAETQAALAELRRLVHERTPPVLDELGLVEALRSLAEASSVPVVIAQDPSYPSDLRRPSIATERAVYGVALSIIRNAEASGASKVSIALTSSDRHFTATFDHDATAPTLDPTDDEDRVGAVGGNLDVTIGAQGAHGLHAMASFPREGAP
jgi:signal transduction histidine kinase